MNLKRYQPMLLALIFLIGNWAMAASPTDLIKKPATDMVKDAATDMAKDAATDTLKKTLGQ